MIEDYSFGRVVVDGKTYRSDVLVFPDGTVKDAWRRSSGHRLELSDIEELIADTPGIIVAGTGRPGLMRPDDDLASLLAEKGIEFEAMPTSKACARYNELSQKSKAAACLHLIC